MKVKIPKKGMCFARPPITDLKPMAWCSLKENHKGKHSWEKK